MSKRGPLSKIEKFYIEQNLELGVDNLASELDRAKSVIKAYAKKCEPKIQQKETTLSQKMPEIIKLLLSSQLKPAKQYSTNNL